MHQRRRPRRVKFKNQRELYTNTNNEREREALHQRAHEPEIHRRIESERTVPRFTDEPRKRHRERVAVAKRVRPILGTREGQVTNEDGIGHKESALRARGREDIFGDLQREFQLDERIVREWVTDDEITARNRSVSSGFG